MQQRFKSAQLMFPSPECDYKVSTAKNIIALIKSASIIKFPGLKN